MEEDTYNDQKALKIEWEFTYAINTYNDKTTQWTSRMEHYMKYGNENIHLAAILLSLGIIIALSCILSTILKRGLNRDFMNIYKNRMSAN